MRVIRILVAVVIIAASSWAAAQTPCPTPLTVNSNAESGCGSLRNAINQANGALCPISVGLPPTINFDPAQLPLVIQPKTPLPPLTCSAGVTIDGFDPVNGQLNTRVFDDGSTNAIIRVTLDGSLCVPTPPA